MWPNRFVPKLMHNCVRDDLGSFCSFQKNLTKLVLNRIARFFLVQTYQKMEKYIPNDHTLYQTAVKQTNGNKMFQMIIKYQYQNFPFQGPPKFTQIGIFGLKI
jgi:hypothetical protein